MIKHSWEALAVLHNDVFTALVETIKLLDFIPLYLTRDEYEIRFHQGVPRYVVEKDYVNGEPVKTSSWQSPLDVCDIDLIEIPDKYYEALSSRRGIDALFLNKQYRYSVIDLSELHYIFYSLEPSFSKV